jgi:hypothetical protein
MMAATKLLRYDTTASRGGVSGYRSCQREAPPREAVVSAAKAMPAVAASVKLHRARRWSRSKKIWVMTRAERGFRPSGSADGRQVVHGLSSSHRITASQRDDCNAPFNRPAGTRCFSRLHAQAVNDLPTLTRPAGAKAGWHWQPRSVRRARFSFCTNHWTRAHSPL